MSYKRRCGTLLKSLGEGVKAWVIRPLQREVFASLFFADSRSVERWFSYFVIS